MEEIGKYCLLTCTLTYRGILVIFTVWFIFICRGVPSGPHIPHEELGGQGEALDQRQRLKDKYFPFCQKQGNYMLLKGVIWSHNLNFKSKSFMKGILGKRMKSLMKRAHGRMNLVMFSTQIHFSFPFCPPSHHTLPFTFLYISLPTHFGQE